MMEHNRYTDQRTDDSELTRTATDVWPGVPLPPSVAPTGPDDWLVIYLHGGAFQFDEASDIYADRLAQAMNCMVLNLHYRVGSDNPYPAASDDSIDLYRDVLSLGWKPNQVLLVGHSSGATLAVSFVLRRAEHGLHQPCGVVALSGVYDFTLQGALTRAEDNPDVITWAQSERVRDTYTGGTVEPGVGVSPALAGATDWDGAPPLFLLCGGSELFLHDTLRVAEQAAAGGVDMTLRIVAGQKHGFAQRAQPISDLVLGEIVEFARRCRQPYPADDSWLSSDWMQERLEAL